MMTRIKYIIASAFAALLIVAGAESASGQIHRIEIGEGRVLIDNQPVADEGLPSSFDSLTIRASFLIEPSARVFLQAEGMLYEVTAAGVREVGVAEQLLPVPVNSDALDSGTPVRFASESPRPGGQPDSAMMEQAELLRERARELQRISFELQQSRMQSDQLFDMIESIHRSATETERVARSLPHIQAQRYMQEMRERNTELYERLVHEQALDRETIELSTRIRSLEEGPERSELVGRLRALLVESLQMKQDNRRQEIAELEERLGSLQRRHERRERHFDRIVERRLNDLIKDENEN